MIGRLPWGISGETLRPVPGPPKVDREERYGHGIQQQPLPQPIVLQDSLSHITQAQPTQRPHQPVQGATSRPGSRAGSRVRTTAQVFTCAIGGGQTAVIFQVSSVKCQGLLAVWHLLLSVNHNNYGERCQTR